jgi:hypothetical protein
MGTKDPVIAFDDCLKALFGTLLSSIVLDISLLWYKKCLLVTFKGADLLL